MNAIGFRFAIGCAIVLLMALWLTFANAMSFTKPSMFIHTRSELLQAISPQGAMEWETPLMWQPIRTVSVWTINGVDYAYV